MTLVIVIFVSLISALYWGVYFKDGCDFYFDHVSRVWSFGDEPCSVWLSFHIDMGYNVCLFIFIGIIDIFTLLQLRSMTKNALSFSPHDSKQNSDITTNRRRKEVLFFSQVETKMILIGFNPEIRRHLVNFRDISRSLHDQVTHVTTMKQQPPTALFKKS
ncbi:unnamed protein product [Strongylus vulgaris]|uniref:7TM GPCR serpentine receptor class x (Srx) domain-containing protein n=1 Tax=Strongylus vulgaris TaxID=40348 RepID=A0A3P7JBL5_STRVU|nr:unnamed protein product [Strongylus vulgaris]